MLNQADYDSLSDKFLVYLKTILKPLNLKSFSFVGIDLLQVLNFEFRKFRISEC